MSHVEAGFERATSEGVCINSDVLHAFLPLYPMKKPLLRMALYEIDSKRQHLLSRGASKIGHMLWSDYESRKLMDLMVHFKRMCTRSRSSHDFTIKGLKEAFSRPLQAHVSDESVIDYPEDSSASPPNYTPCIIDYPEDSSGSPPNYPEGSSSEEEPAPVTREPLMEITPAKRMRFDEALGSQSSSKLTSSRRRSSAKPSAAISSEVDKLLAKFANSEVPPPNMTQARKRILELKKERAPKTKGSKAASAGAAEKVEMSPESLEYVKAMLALEEVDVHPELAPEHVKVQKKMERNVELFQICIGKTKLCQVTVRQFGAAASDVSHACMRLAELGCSREAIKAAKSKLLSDEEYAERFQECSQ